MSAGKKRLVVASNRGPVSFARDESGRPVTRRGAGGLVTAVSVALAGALEEELRPADGLEAVTLVQDYHLGLVPALLRERSPGTPIVHFSHIPFAGPTGLRILPQPVRESLLVGMLGADVVGFQAP